MTKINQFTEEEVAKHNKEDDVWLIIGNDDNGGQKVYNVTEYLNEHPGGPEVIMDYAGRDADEMFEDISHSQDARKRLAQLQIGVLKVDPKEKARKEAEKKAQREAAGGGINFTALLVVIVALVGGYLYSQQVQKEE